MTYPMNRSRPLLLLAAVSLLASCGTKVPDYTVGRSEICAVHQVKMTRTSVPIMYGLPLWNEKTTARSKASAKLFPHAGDSLEGGCLVDSRNPKQAMVFVCPDCQGKSQRWDLEHQNQP